MRTLRGDCQKGAGGYPTAVVTLSQPTDFEVLKKAVEDKDYKVTE